MAILGKKSKFLTQILTKQKNFFWRLCPRAFLVVPICQNIFFKCSVFLKIFLKIGWLSIQFYSVAKELCSMECWLLEKPFGNGSGHTVTLQRGRSSTKWVARPIYEAKNYSWKFEIMEKVQLEWTMLYKHLYRNVKKFLPLFSHFHIQAQTTIIVN